MTVRKFESRFNAGAFVMYLISLLLLVACYLTFTLIPESDTFTNSLKVSGEETIKAFTVVPVLGLLSCIVFCAFIIVFAKYFLKLSFADNKFGDKTIGNTLIKAVSFSSSALLLILLVISTVLAFLLYNDFRELGFVAPITDTVYESYGNFILADCIIHFIFLILTALKMLGISVTDSIGSLFTDKEKKS